MCNEVNEVMRSKLSARKAGIVKLAAEPEAAAEAEGKQTTVRRVVWTRVRPGESDDAAGDAARDLQSFIDVELPSGLQVDEHACGADGGVNLRPAGHRVWNDSVEADAARVRAWWGLRARGWCWPPQT